MGSNDRLTRRGFLEGVAGVLPALPCLRGAEQLSIYADTPLPPNGLAQTPPMGWNSYNHFKENINDALIRAQAQAVVTSRMKAVGYVLLDSGWKGKRDAKGLLQPNSRFPDMQALSNYVHSLGLKLGIYSSPARVACGVGPGSMGHESQDAQTFATWRIDYLKCNLFGLEDQFNQMARRSLKSAHQMMVEAYRKMGVALRATGRPIVYSLCQYGMDAVWEWGPSVGANLWRTTSDIRPSYWDISMNGFVQAGLSRFAKPGRWNDPDMLEIGNGRVADGAAPEVLPLSCK